MFCSKKATLVTLLVLLACNKPVHAQVERATTTADPARIGQDLLQKNVSPQNTSEGVIEQPDRQFNNAPPGAAAIKFKLETLKIEGVDAYDEGEILYIYEDALNDEVTLEEIYRISNDLTNKYRNDGYILTQVIVPPQTIKQGLVKLRVVEGFIDQVIIEGETDPGAAKRIRNYAENIRAETVVNTKTLEHYLLLINDLPGVKARSVLSPSKTMTGAADLTIIVERDRYEAQISFDNLGSRFLGPYQGSYQGTLNSFLGWNERISSIFVVSGDKNRTDELLFGSITYEQPISNQGTMIRLTGSVTDTEPGANLDQFNVEGRSRYVSAGVSHPFIRSRTQNLSARVGFDFRSVESKNDLEVTRRDQISSLRAGVTFQFIDTFLRVGVNALDVEISHGTGLFGASKQGDDNLTRADGNPRYTKISAQWQRLQRLSPTLNVLLAARGQLASTPLLSSEEFGFGGSSFGRGYDSSEIVGEDGFAGKAELQWNEPKKIKYIDDYQLYTFFDAGRAYNQDPTTNDDKRESLTSAGLGVRANITKNTELGLGVAIPLTRRVDVTNDRDPRYFFSLTHKF